MPSVIRMATPRDAAEIQAIYAPSVTDTPVSFELEPPTVEEMRGRIVQTLERLPWLVCEQEGGVAGYVYASAHRARAAYQWAVDVAVYIHPERRRGGVGRALYTSLFSILAVQGYRTACAGITLPNAASVGLHESMGFMPVGVYRSIGYKMGAWHDVGWWQRPLSTHVGPPPDLVPLASVQATAEWQAGLAAGLSLLRSS